MSAWADQSGNGYDLISATNPTLVTNSINGHPSIEFQGSITNAYMTSNGLTLAQPLSVFIVTQPVVFGGEMGSYNNIIGSNSNDLQFIYYRGGSSDLGQGSYEIYAGSNEIRNGSWPDSGNNWYSTIFQVDGASSEILVNNEVESSGNPGSLGFSNIIVGRYFGGGQYFKGRIAEMIIYDHTLNTDERNVLASYVSNRYGI